jgi:hypothetical protein
MNYFKAYSKALHSKWHELILKWFFKTGIKRILIAFILLIAATVLSMHELICDFLSDFDFNPGFSWIDYVTFFAKLIAIIIFILNGLAWAISEFKYNVIFLTQMTLVAIYFMLVYANVIWNQALIPITLVILSIIILIQPKQKRKRIRRRSSSRSSSSSRSRSKKTNTSDASPEANIREV